MCVFMCLCFHECVCANERLLLCVCLAVLFACVGLERGGFSGCAAASSTTTFTCLYFGLSAL